MAAEVIDFSSYFIEWYCILFVNLYYFTSSQRSPHVFLTSAITLRGPKIRWHYGLIAFLAYWSIIIIFFNLILAPNLPCKLDDVKCITNATEWAVSTTMPEISERRISSTDPSNYEIIDGFLGYVQYKLIKPQFRGINTCKVAKARYV